MIKIMTTEIKAKENLLVVNVQCGIHAREWISHATCLYIIHQRRFLPIGDAGRASPADPCSLTFYGDYAFSEIETRASRDALLGNRTEFFFDLHSYGTMWMFPCGHTDARVPEYDQLLIRQTLFRRGLGKNRAAEAIEKVNGAVYKVGAMYETIYPMSGGSTDWAYDKAGVRKSFSIELQPKQSRV
nr:zinc carboxypeptidase-like [Rhipicephalus microplus]